MNNMRFLFVALAILLIHGFVSAQDFGFGFDDVDENIPAPAVSVKLGGEVGVEILPYVHDFEKKEGGQAISPWDMISGKLNLKAAGGNVEAVAAFNLNAAAISELWDASSKLDDPAYTPLIIDEAYLQGYIGHVNIAAGLRKLTWGKADSLGPLDVITPLDYSDLRKMTDIQAIKIARPLVHVSWNMDGFSKLEGVFIPNFAGHRFASEGRWTPSQYRDMKTVAEAGIFSRANELQGAAISNPLLKPVFDNVKNNLLKYFDSYAVPFPITGGIDYFQAGLRFTTTIGPADLGVQYFYGNLFRPGFTIGGIDDFLGDLVKNILFGNYTYYGDPNLLSPNIAYNRYHQFGLDYAQVLFGFNIRSEFAFHLTEDFEGDDGTIQNPFIAWSLGFDRDLFWGINANVQCNETIRLFNDKVGDNPVLDCEAGTEATSTRLTMQVSKKFFRDELECKIIGIWGIEDMDCYIIPALIWTVKDFTTELSAGVFAGKESGELGQYWENSFVKFGVKYSF
jgi:hypothetical protein